MVVKDNNVICDYCGKVLFKTNQKENGHIAFQAKEKGFVIKHTLFYGGTEFKIFAIRSVVINGLMKTYL